MHKIDGPGATEEQRFTEGDPVVPIPATDVTADWLNAVQDEFVNVLAAAGITPDKADNTQVLGAIRQLVLDGRRHLAVTAPLEVSFAEGTGAATFALSSGAKYDLCEFYYFRNPTLRPGFQPAQGGLLANAATLYPEVWAYLQTTEGQKLCKTEAEWQAMTTAIWATLADGSTVGWNGIGGAPFYAPNLATGALRLPDLRGMYAEAAGYDSLSVGGVHGDAVRDMSGRFTPGWNSCFLPTAYANGVFGTPYAKAGTLWLAADRSENQPLSVDFLSSRVVPTAAKNQPRAWGALPCAYLGLPR